LMMMSKRNWRKSVRKPGRASLHIAPAERLTNHDFLPWKLVGQGVPYRRDSDNTAFILQKSGFAPPKHMNCGIGYRI
jgi:hypothetical protein